MTSPCFFNKVKFFLCEGHSIPVYDIWRQIERISLKKKSKIGIQSVYIYGCIKAIVYVLLTDEQIYFEFNNTNYLHFC